MNDTNQLFNVLAILDENNPFGSSSHRRIVSYLYLLTISDCSNKAFMDLSLVNRYCNGDEAITKLDFYGNYYATFVCFGGAINVANSVLRSREYYGTTVEQEFKVAEK
jgi:hypothetical protein